MKRFTVEFFVSALCLLVLWGGGIHNLRMRIFPYDFPMWKLKFDIASGKNHNYDIIVLGDSLPNAAINPNLINKDMFNLSLGGSSPIDGLFLFRKYLENHTPPKSVIISYAGASLVPQEVFAFQSMTFNLHSFWEMLALRKGIKAYPEFYDYAVNAPVYLAQSFKYNKRNDLNYAIDGLLSSVYLSRYQLSFNQNLLSDKTYLINTKIYNESVLQKGQHNFGEEARDSRIPNPELRRVFSVHPLIDKSFRTLVELCIQHKIKVYFLAAPINEIYLSYFDKSYFENYRSYLKTFSNEGGMVTFVDKFSFYSPEHFSDPDHANSMGMVKFSTMLKGVLGNN